ncbi:hypothetical protein [Evansella tamaricis]|uniref:Uncharacterized protein n=1 Tax=Evansella tamaricis TaxID=2069301 RepID=A0ABS6JLA9_9BACI|nr:hypothetical protein [Evansella tamaricis]MBU9714456.1 hypothetical protein [Evansella tamaricis]
MRKLGQDYKSSYNNLSVEDHEELSAAYKQFTGTDLPVLDHYVQCVLKG